MTLPCMSHGGTCHAVKAAPRCISHTISSTELVLSHSARRCDAGLIDSAGVGAGAVPHSSVHIDVPASVPSQFVISEAIFSSKSRSNCLSVHSQVFLKPLLTSLSHPLPVKQLTKCIQHAECPEDVLEIVNANYDNLNPTHVSAALARLVRWFRLECGETTDPQVVQGSCRAVYRQQCLGRCRTTLSVLLASAHKQLHGAKWDVHLLVTAVWACGTFGGVEEAFIRPFVDALLQRSSQALSKGSLQQCAMVSCGLAQLGWCHPPSWVSLACIIGPKLHSPKDTQALALIAWAFATANRADYTLFASISQAVQQCGDRLRPADCVQLAWAFAKSRQYYPEVFRAVAGAIAPVAWQCRPGELCVMAWAFASIRCSTPTFFSAVAGSLPSRLQGLSCANLAQVAWAFARRWHYDARLFEGVAQELLGRVHELNTLQVVQLCWAMARIDHPCSELMHALLCRAVTLMLPDIRRPHGASSVLLVDGARPSLFSGRVARSSHVAQLGHSNIGFFGNESSCNSDDNISRDDYDNSRCDFSRNSARIIGRSIPSNLAGMDQAIVADVWDSSRDISKQARWSLIQSGADRSLQVQRQHPSSSQASLPQHLSPQPSASHPTLASEPTQPAHASKSSLSKLSVEQLMLSSQSTAAQVPSSLQPPAVSSPLHVSSLQLPLPQSSFPLPGVLKPSPNEPCLSQSSSHTATQQQPTPPPSVPSQPALPQPSVPQWSSSQPATSQPSMALPSTAEPTTPQPTTPQPTTPQPTIPQHKILQAVIPQPSTIPAQPLLPLPSAAQGSTPCTPFPVQPWPRPWPPLHMHSSPSPKVSSTLLWSLARTCQYHPRLFEHLARSALSHACQINTCEIVGITWGLATTCHNTSVVPALAFCAQTIIRDFQPSELANLAWNFAALSCTEPIPSPLASSPLFRSDGGPGARLDDHFGPEFGSNLGCEAGSRLDNGSIADGLRTAGGEMNNGVLGHGLGSAVAEASGNRLSYESGYRMGDESGYRMGYESLDMQSQGEKPSWVEDVFDAISEAAVEKMGSMELGPLSKLLWAVARVNFSNERLFGQAARRLMQRADALSLASLGRLSWAYAVTNMYHPPLFKAMAASACKLLQLQCSEPLSLPSTYSDPPSSTHLTPQPSSCLLNPQPPLSCLTAQPSPSHPTPQPSSSHLISQHSHSHSHLTPQPYPYSPQCLPAAASTHNAEPALRPHHTPPSVMPAPASFSPHVSNHAPLSCPNPQPPRPTPASLTTCTPNNSTLPRPTQNPSRPAPGSLSSSSPSLPSRHSPTPQSARPTPASLPASAADLANLLAGFALVGVEDGAMMDAVADWAVRHTSDLTLAAAADLASSFATLGRYHPRLMCTLCDAALQQLQPTHLPHLATILWALATLNHPHTQLFTQAAPVLLQYSSQNYFANQPGASAPLKTPAPSTAQPSHIKPTECPASSTASAASQAEPPGSPIESAASQTQSPASHTQPPPPQPQPAALCSSVSTALEPSQPRLPPSSIHADATGITSSSNASTTTETSSSTYLQHPKFPIELAPLHPSTPRSHSHPSDLTVEHLSCVAWAYCHVNAAGAVGLRVVRHLILLAAPQLHNASPEDLARLLWAAAQLKAQQCTYGSCKQPPWETHVPTQNTSQPLELPAPSRHNSGASDAAAQVQGSELQSSGQDVAIEQLVLAVCESVRQWDAGAFDQHELLLLGAAREVWLPFTLPLGKRLEQQCARVWDEKKRKAGHGFTRNRSGSV